MSEFEAKLILPVLVEKAGHNQVCEGEGSVSFRAIFLQKKGPILNISSS